MKISCTKIFIQDRTTVIEQSFTTKIFVHENFYHKNFLYGNKANYGSRYCSAMVPTLVENSKF